MCPSSNAISRPAVQSLVSTAVSQGLPQAAGQVMIANLDDTVLQGCVGAPIDQLDSTEATLFVVAIDASASMFTHQQAVIAEYNRCIEALKTAKGAATILTSLWTFNDQPNLVHGYQKIEQVPALDSRSYAPNGCTALYPTLTSCLTGLTTYGQQLSDAGVLNRRILFVLTDGQHYLPNPPPGHATSLADVRTAVTAVAQREDYMLAFAGFGDASTDLVRLAGDMGFPPHGVTNGKNASELRRIFGQVSQSVSRISQGALSSSFFT